MILGVIEDYTTEDVYIDEQLLDNSDSGLYLNSGVHPSLNLRNLLDFLPFEEPEFKSYSTTKAYNVYNESFKREDVVKHNGVLYLCLQANTGEVPNTSSDYWLRTSIESLRIRSFIKKVEERVKSELNLNKRLVNNQFIYENGINNIDIPEDFFGWAFEPRGSDYVSIRINSLSFCKDGITPVDFYIINQGVQVDTFQVTPDDGRTVFKRINKVMSGKDPFYLVTPSTQVKKGRNYNDPLKYDGFLAYPVIGKGVSVESADYRALYYGNGIGLNLSAFFDGTAYLEDNISDYGSFVRATLEYLAFQTFLHNSNNRSNRSEAIQLEDNLLMAELKDKDADTVISRFYKERKYAKRRLEKTLDTSLKEDIDSDDSLIIETSSV